jgi:Tannase-like family of unknown function (DUF6351)
MQRCSSHSRCLRLPQAAWGPSLRLARSAAVTILSPPNLGGIQSAAPASYIGLAESGYVEQEFFLSGMAARYANTSVRLIHHPIRGPVFSGPHQTPFN